MENGKIARVETRDENLVRREIYDIPHAGSGRAVDLADRTRRRSDSRSCGLIGSLPGKGPIPTRAVRDPRARRQEREPAVLRAVQPKGAKP